MAAASSGVRPPSASTGSSEAPSGTQTTYFTAPDRRWGSTATRHRLGAHAVEAGGVEAEDLGLALLRERGVAEALLELGRDLERPQRLDLSLGRAVPDRVGAPDDVVLADEPEQLAEHVRGLVG